MSRFALTTGVAVFASILLAIGEARAEILVRTDGGMAEGKVVSRDGKELVFLPDGADPSAALHVDLAKVSRLLTTDEHGALLADKSPTTRPATQPAKSAVPPEPAAPRIVARPAGPTYYLIPLHGEVGVTILASALEKSLADAAARKPTVVVLDITSPGGLVDEAQKIISVLHRYNKQLRIVALADQDLSAAAVFSLSVKEIYLKSTGTIGAATSFIPGSPGLSAKVEEKMQSAWRAVARNSAEEGGHEPLLAEAMIDNTLSLHVDKVNGKPVVAEGPGPKQLCRSGKILTLTSHEAVDCGLAAGDADDVTELGTALKLPNWTECKGLGTVLADYLPQRAEAFQREIEKVQSRFLHDVGEAVENDPSQATVTTTHTTILAQPGRPAYGNPRAPMQPGRSVTTTVRRSHTHWKAESLVCVVALQQAEADLKQGIAVCQAFAEASQVEMLKEALDQISAARIRVYDDRNKYGLTDEAPRSAAAPAPTTGPASPARPAPLANPGQAPGVPPVTPRQPVLPVAALSTMPDNAGKTELLGGNAGQEYTAIQPAAGSFFGFRYVQGTALGKSYMRRLEPIFQDPPPDSPRGLAYTTIMARDGYVVGGMFVETDNTKIVAFKVIFVHFKGGHVDATDTYQSDWVGTHGDRPTHQLAGNGETVIGVFGRKGLSIEAIGLVTEAPKGAPAAKPVAVVEQKADAAAQGEVIVEALIDGNSELHVTSTGLYWKHLGHMSKPGMHSRNNLPTYINHTAWMPEWGQPTTTSAADQSKPYPLDLGKLGFSVETLAVGGGDDDKTPEKIQGIEPRDPVTIADKGAEQVISIPDRQFGAKWYRIRIYRK